MSKRVRVGVREYYSHNEVRVEVSDKLKELLYAKAAERIEAAKPIVANTMFNEPEQGEVEVEDEVEQEPQEDQGE